MLTEVTLSLLRLVFLGLLWVMVITIVVVLRRDMYGTQVAKRSTSTLTNRVRANPTAPNPPGNGGPGPHYLVVTKGPLKGTTLTLGMAQILMGRAPECTLVLDDDFASNRHARISPSGTGWVLEDLGSTNGTFIGRTQVTTPTPVDVGMAIRVGRTVVELRR